MNSEHDYEHDDPLTEAELASMELCCAFANLSEAELLSAIEEMNGETATD